jgi:hypothetical protein
MKGRSDTSVRKFSVLLIDKLHQAVKSSSSIRPLLLFLLRNTSLEVTQ